MYREGKRTSIEAIPLDTALGWLSVELATNYYKQYQKVFSEIYDKIILFKQ
ncbi:MAG: hypothetical protein F6K50_05615 [Moorea sp. SIO3I7]|nr:hypothetical protein [Moorena sp. SIO3I7]NEO50900.1 hypothetical protein [Moorena sp. SIO4A3]